ncbi:Tropomyosin-1 [Dactylellina cionopaga]|nr:Tropomyosin-1 [Dactylellina cionopaga]
MDRIKDKLTKLSADLEVAKAANEDLQKEKKDLDAVLLSKENDISSFTHKNTQLEADIEKLEKALADAKKEALEGAQHGTTSDNLQRKVQILEEEAEVTEKQLKETIEKLRLTDAKAEDFERRFKAMEAERDNWEKKYEEVNAKLAKAEKDLEELNASLDNI